MADYDCEWCDKANECSRGYQEACPFYKMEEGLENLELIKDVDDILKNLQGKLEEAGVFESVKWEIERIRREIDYDYLDKETIVEYKKLFKKE